MQNPYSILTGLIGSTLGAVSVQFFALMILLSFVCILIGIGLFVLWIITLVDCIKRSENDFTGIGSYEKIMWLLLIIFINNVVPIIYYILVMRKKNPDAVSKAENCVGK
ncbi:MAG: PLDc N-terminal domain-containing protein [Actinomycetota bacterium]|nr:PLDc N-terminal domain-containing protein [Actinomycetota bacterium]